MSDLVSFACQCVRLNPTWAAFYCNSEKIAGSLLVKKCINSKRPAGWNDAIQSALVLAQGHSYSLLNGRMGRTLSLTEASTVIVGNYINPLRKGCWLG